MDKTKKAVRLKNNLTASYDWLGNKDSNLDRRSQSPFLVTFTSFHVLSHTYVKALTYGCLAANLSS